MDSTHLRLLRNSSKRRERIVQRLLIRARVEVSDEQVCSNIKLLLVVARFVDTDRLSKQLNLVHDLASVVRVFLGQEFAEPEALVLHRDAVFREEHVRCWSAFTFRALQLDIVKIRTHRSRLPVSSAHVRMEKAYSINSQISASVHRSSRLPCLVSSMQHRRELTKYTVAS